MPRVRCTTVLALAGVLFAHAGMASCIDCLRSTIPTWVRVTGLTSNGAPDPDGLYCVTMRDFSDNPIGGIRVQLDLSACCDLSICSEAVPGQKLKSCTPPVI